ncbi:MAG TPA: YhjD/YihY/BrkB family envelope integrity protein [Acidimicrobiales bacterium]|nr:YhjD/YihY/BrkB family envelope integrity protein [Acidimicrobiales bacterium]
MERLVRWFDDRQSERWWLAYPVATVRKYADDRGSAFAGLVTFQAFLALLPTLVVVLTVVSHLTDGSSRIRAAVVGSTLSQLPVVGQRIRDDVSTVGATGPWAAVAIAGLLWTAAGIYHSTQLALNQVWNVEGVHRQGFVSRHIRAGILFALFISAAIGTSFLPMRQALGVLPPVLADSVSAVGGAVIAAVLLLGVLRLVVAPVVPLRCLVPSAILAGLLWQLLQLIGTWFVTERLANASDLYGSIGFIVVTLSWINLLARTMIFSNEWAVVAVRELWPRRIAQPPLTAADKRVLSELARNERRRPEQHVHVTFDDDDDDDTLAS